ncbi:hypothetical protein JZK55_20250 [Dissulfurispira thermophila]|uniref:DinB family protein n=2 Tax=root TaxID=1 RepID=A0A7G1H4P5_9BACT|nr:hypothetical protein [Dissulfurispira thermophila]BCB97103.1 hypothetical protein JZK55_20250 [Dissulfurispira thermophila]
MQTISASINPTFKTLIDELRDTCLETVKLINQMEIEHLTEDQMEEILGELSVSVMHLQMHAGFVKEEIDKED